MIQLKSSATVSLIQKEDLEQLYFPTDEVLNNKEEIQIRRRTLEQAVVLGNTYKGKTRIIFEDSAGIKQVETHIWGLTDKRVILRQGIVIPIHRIHDVKL